MANYFNELSKLLYSLGRKHGLSRAFNDLLTVSICSYHPVNIENMRSGIAFEDFKKDTTNEELYFKTIEPYSKEELNQLAKTIGNLQLHNAKQPYNDFLGDFFTADITKGHNGQFFTPDSICTLMAQMTMPEKISSKRILDPACGSAS